MADERINKLNCWNCPDRPALREVLVHRHGKVLQFAIYQCSECKLLTAVTWDEEKGK